jgi:hypothetical protein
MTMEPTGFMTPMQEDRLFAARRAVECLRSGGCEYFAADIARPLVASRGVVAHAVVPLGQVVLRFRHLSEADGFVLHVYPLGQRHDVAVADSVCSSL